MNPDKAIQLPNQSIKKKGFKTLVLDLDETLIHASNIEFDNA